MCGCIILFQSENAIQFNSIQRCNKRIWKTWNWKGMQQNVQHSRNRNFMRLPDHIMDLQTYSYQQPDTVECLSFLSMAFILFFSSFFLTKHQKLTYFSHYLLFIYCVISFLFVVFMIFIYLYINRRKMKCFCSFYASEWWLCHENLANI